MSEKNMRLRIVLDLAGKALAPLKKIDAASKATAGAIKATREQLKQLGETQKTIGSFRQARTGLAETETRLKAAREQVRQLTAAFSQSSAPTKAMVRELAGARAEAARLGDSFGTQRARVQQLRDQLSAAGISTRNLASQGQQLRASIASTTQQLQRQTDALKRQADAQRRLSRLQQQAGRGAAIGGGMAAGGAGALYGGRRALGAAGGLMGQGKDTATEEARIKALGLDAQEAALAIDFARQFSSFGTSRLDNLMLMRDAITVFNDRAHAQDALPFLARMKAGNEAVFGAEHGADNERKFMDMLKVIEMRNGANNRADFERNGNLIQQVITATGGRVGAEDWLNLIKTGGVAAKGISEKEFFYRLEPLVQEMGGHRVGTGMMSAYQNIYQGRTTKRAANMLQDLGLIADPSKVKHDKVGQIAQLGVGALKGSDIFQRSQFEWMETVLIPALHAKGYTSEKQVLDAMGGIFSNRNAAGLFATMYQQRAMISKSYALNERADNVDTLFGRARTLPAGHEIELQKRRDDLLNDMGTMALPAYVQLLEALQKLARAAQGFAQRNPLLVKALIYGAVAVGALSVALGALLIPLGLLLAKGMLLRFLVARIGVGFGLTGGAARTAGPALGLLARAWAWGAGALAQLGPWLLRGAQWLGAWGAALATYLPAVLRFGLVLLRVATGPAGLLALAATLLYSRWADVVGGFKLLMQDIGAAVQAAAQYVLGLGARFFDAGTAIVQGIANGITSRIAAVRDAIGAAAGGAIDWFKEKLGIRSPSRVFMQLGGFVGEGAAAGIRSGGAAVRAAALGLAAASAVPMAAAAGVPANAMGAGGGPALAAAPRAYAPAGGGVYTINIHAAPGADAQAIARAVTAELDRRERAIGARQRSALRDLN